MSLARDGVLAAIVAVAGGAALVLYPVDTVPGEAPGDPPPPVPPPGDAPEADDPAEDPAEDPAGDAEAPPPETPPEEAEAPAPEAPPAEPPAPVDEAGSVFRYDPPGVLTEYDYQSETAVPGFSGVGFKGTDAFDRNYVFAPGLTWPLAERGFPNSQVYRPGGWRARGGQCDASNYDYPWQDNFCETRGRGNALCESGRGHQGQDIRPASCPPSTGAAHTAVAAVDGYIAEIASMTVKLRDAETGRIYWYMHLQHWDRCEDPGTLSRADCDAGRIGTLCSGHALSVDVGDEVSAGDPIGVVSNWFGIGWSEPLDRCVWTPTTHHRRKERP